MLPIEDNPGSGDDVDEAEANQMAEETSRKRAALRQRPDEAAAAVNMRGTPNEGNVDPDTAVDTSTVTVSPVATMEVEIPAEHSTVDPDTAVLDDGLGVAATRDDSLDSYM